MDVNQPRSMRREIAAAAAQLVADSGLDYASAKQKAARDVAGGQRLPRNQLPDNDEVDEALREHLLLFDGEHPARLARMRGVAVELMRELSRFHPLATGAVWKGIATEHVPIHLQLFHDNGKEVGFFLIDRRIAFDATTAPHWRTGEDVEAFVFEWRGEPVLLSVYGHDDLRGALRGGAQGAERGDLQALQTLAEAVQR